MPTGGNGTAICSKYLESTVNCIFSIFPVSEYDVNFLPFLTTNRLGGFIVLVIYMVTVYSVYVPDWSYVYHSKGDIDDGKLFTVLGA
jgi:hypothetical protein